MKRDIERQDLSFIHSHTLVLYLKAGSLPPKQPQGMDHIGGEGWGCCHCFPTGSQGKGLEFVQGTGNNSSTLHERHRWMFNVHQLTITDGTTSFITSIRCTVHCALCHGMPCLQRTNSPFCGRVRNQTQATQLTDPHQVCYLCILSDLIPHTSPKQNLHSSSMLNARPLRHSVIPSYLICITFFPIES